MTSELKHFINLLYKYKKEKKSAYSDPRKTVRGLELLGPLNKKDRKVINLPDSGIHRRTGTSVA